MILLHQVQITRQLIYKVKSQDSCCPAIGGGVATGSGVVRDS